MNKKMVMGVMLVALNLQGMERKNNAKKVAFAVKDTLGKAQADYLRQISKGAAQEGNERQFKENAVAYYQALTVYEEAVAEKERNIERREMQQNSARAERVITDALKCCGSAFVGSVMMYIYNSCSGK